MGVLVTLILIWIFMLITIKASVKTLTAIALVIFCLAVYFADDLEENPSGLPKHHKTHSP